MCPPERPRHEPDLRERGMTGAVLVFPLLVWGLWWLHNGGRIQSTDATAGESDAFDAKRICGLEDNPDAWPVRGPWTALDERQLIRMLTEAAPVERPVSDAIERRIPPVEHEDNA